MLELVLTVCSLVQGAACRDLDTIPLGQASRLRICVASRGREMGRGSPELLHRARYLPAREQNGEDLMEGSYRS